MKTILHIDGKPVTLEKLQRKGSEVTFSINGREFRFRGERTGHGGFLLEEEISSGLWRRTSGVSWAGGQGSRKIQIGAIEATVTQAHGAVPAATGQAILSPPAPMPGLVRQLHVKAGERVKKGQALVVIEAMKLQMTLSAGGDAMVEAVLVKEGTLVAEGAELVKLKAGNSPLPL